MKTKYYTYYLIDPESGDVFYIGAGQNGRMYNHVTSVRRGYYPNGNKHLYNKINKILKKGLNVKYKKIFESYDRQDVFQKEKEEISKIGLKKLCNITEGGETGRPLPHTKETKEKISKALLKNHPFRGKSLKESHKKAISEANKGKKTPENVKKKIGDRYYPTGSENPNSVTYIIESPDGVVHKIDTKNNVKKFITNENKKLLGDAFVSGKSNPNRISWKKILFRSGESKGWKLIDKIK